MAIMMSSLNTEDIMNPLRGYIYSLSTDHTLPDELYNYIKNTHPQVNDKTKLAFVPYLNWNLVRSDGYDPAFQRYRYIWNSKPGCKGRLWRVFGMLLDRVDWFHNGIEWTAVPVEPSLPTYNKQIRLTGYGASKVRDGERISLVIYLAYEPLSDTLYIRRD